MNIDISKIIPGEKEEPGIAPEKGLLNLVQYKHHCIASPFGILR